MINRFEINTNAFLTKSTSGYYHQCYTGYRNPGNPDYLNVLKNTYNEKSRSNLICARDEVISVLTRDIPEAMKENNITSCVCVPRAKALETYSESQLMFKAAVSIASQKINGVIDGTDCIRRVVNTRTTHLRNAINITNDGEEPYRGITIATCEINEHLIMNQKVILVDDIYTRNVNIDEDCIQALMDSGADEVIFYSVGYTRRN